MNKLFAFIIIVFMCSTSSLEAQKENFIGKWDLETEKDGQTLPSWLEIYKSGHGTLVGNFVFAFGSARPVSEFQYDDGSIFFSIPNQWEPKGQNMVFSATEENDILSGVMIYTDGTTATWKGVRAPKLEYNKNPVWGDKIDLFNGENLEGWSVKGNNEWEIIDGILTNKKSGGNLISNDLFNDFKLNVEFRYPEGSNSGIYLRGRYEVQIQDDRGKEAANTLFGGVYGFLTPNENMAGNPGEWQSYEITLIGRRVTIVANGQPVIVEQNIPGITGGALDSKEGEPGPILIQGDHGPVEFRKIEITPVTN